MTDNSKKDGAAWFRDLQAQKHAETVTIVEKAKQKDPKDRSGEDFLAAHRLKVADRRKHFVEKFKSKNEH